VPASTTQMGGSAGALSALTEFFDAHLSSPVRVGAV